MHPLGKQEHLDDCAQLLLKSSLQVKFLFAATKSSGLLTGIYFSFVPSFFLLIFQPPWFSDLLISFAVASNPFLNEAG